MATEEESLEATQWGFPFPFKIEVIDVQCEIEVNLNYLLVRS